MPPKALSPNERCVVTDGFIAPPAGPTLDFRAWAIIIHRRLSSYLKDVHASGGDGVIRWTRGHECVRLEFTPLTWWVNFERNDAFAVPPLAVGRHDEFTARNVADSILGFFEPKLSVPNKPTPELASRS